MLNRSAPILASFIAVLMCVVLVGQRLDAKWAGGIGHVDPCPATSLEPGGSTIVRGQIMSSPTDTFAKYQLCDGTMLYLDSNTQIRLSQYQNPLASQNTQLELIQGRVIVDGLADVRARNTVISMTGAGCELVHYSWLDEIDVTPLVEAACTIVNPPITPPASQTTKYGTFDAVVVSTNTFEPTSSSAKSFYEWTGLKY